MDVEARIYLPEKPLENVWGYGEVTVEGLFTFQVRLLNYQKESGKKHPLLVSQGERYKDNGKM